MGRRDVSFVPQVRFFWASRNLPLLRHYKGKAFLHGMCTVGIGMRTQPSIKNIPLYFTLWTLSRKNLVWFFSSTSITTKHDKYLTLFQNLVFVSRVSSRATHTGLDRNRLLSHSAPLLVLDLVQKEQKAYLFSITQSRKTRTRSCELIAVWKKKKHNLQFFLSINGVCFVPSFVTTRQKATIFPTEPKATIS